MGYGLRAGFFAAVPLVLGLVLGSLDFGVIAAVGTLNLFMVQAPRPTKTPLPIIVVAVGTSAAAFAMGTVIGTTSGAAEVALVGVGIFLALLTKRYAAADELGLIAAVMFVIGVGLSNGVTPAGWRGLAVLLGGLWALAGVVLLPRLPRGIERSQHGAEAPASGSPRPHALTLMYAAAVAATAAAGLAVGGALGLARPFWIMLAVLFALRPVFAATLHFTAMRIIGTTAGAAVALVVTLATGDLWLLVSVIVLAAAAAFAVRAVNYIVFALMGTVYLFLLLNLIAMGGPILAVDRAVDTLVGGTLALVTGVSLSIWPWSARHRDRSPLPVTPIHPM
jgi:hypothetical protein